MSIPDAIQTDLGKAIYLYLQSARNASLSELRTELNTTYMRLYAVIPTLEKRGLVERLDASPERVVFTA